MSRLQVFFLPLLLNLKFPALEIHNRKVVNNWNSILYYLNLLTNLDLTVKKSLVDWSKVTMQAEYRKKINPTYWDRVHVQPRVRKFPDTGVSSETTGRRWQPPPAEVVQALKPPVPEVTSYDRDYTVTGQLTRSQTFEDFGDKAPETHRFNKHTACAENEYIYPPSRRLADQPPLCNGHGTTEMRHAYKVPELPPTLVTDKNQHKHPACLPDPPMVEPSWHKDLEPLDTTHEGYEKYLDPYLTTSRLHHRPYTTEQLSRRSVTKDIVTYHTLSQEPWVRTRKPALDEWRLRLEGHTIKYDRESIRKNSAFSLPKEHAFREMITHNKPRWVPGSFRTEVRDNYISPPSQAGANINEFEQMVQTYYKRSLSDLQTNTYFEHSTMKEKFASETSHIGTGRPICSVLDQFTEKNKKLQLRCMRIS